VSLPYQKAILNWMCDDDIEEVNWQKSKRVGYTKCLLASIGCMTEHKRRNIVLWQPTDGDRDRFSKTEVDALLRDVPVMAKILRCTVGAKDKNNTIEQKVFFGATLDLKGGKSGGSYRAMTKDVAMYDELDAFDADVDKEGSPVELGDGRLEDSSFPKSIRGTTPKIKGISLIEAEIANCDHVFYRFLPCPHCSNLHKLEFKNLKWDEGNSKTARFVCPECGGEYRYSEYRAMDEKGRWQTDQGVYYREDTDLFYDENDERIDKPIRIGAKIWAAYSYFRPWPYIVKKWIEAVRDAKIGNLSKLKTATNTILGETWEEKGEKVESGQFAGSRLENYLQHDKIPNDICMITIGADVQGGKNSRIELEIVGWGQGFESWSLGYIDIPGDPEKEDIWQHLDDQFLRRFVREDGVVLGVAGGCVDAGYLPDRVFNFTGPRRKRNIYATKGKAQYSGPLFKVSTEQWKNKKIHQLSVNTDNAKETVFHRLNKILEPGPGYCHFPDHYDEHYFKKLTNEEKREKKKSGMVVGHQWVKLGPNEPLDCRTGNLVAIARLNPNLPALDKQYRSMAENIRLELPTRQIQTRPGRRVRSEGV